MLLSIVECSNHKLWQGEATPIFSRPLSNHIEVVGPVLGKNVASMRNKGAHKSLGEWIFFKDADCQVSPKDILNTLQKINKTQPIDAISGVYRCSKTNLWQRAYNVVQKKWVLRGLGLKIRPQFYLGSHLLGGALLVRREVFFAVNGFSEVIGWGGEETHFLQKLHEAGFKTAVDYSLRVEHHNRLRVRGFFKRAWIQNYHRGYYKIKVPLVRKSQHLSYLKVKKRLVLPTILFFLVSLMAYSIGVVIRFFKPKETYRYA